MSFLRTLLGGMICQLRIVLRALRRKHHMRFLVAIEVAVAAVLLAACVVAISWTRIFAVYAELMIMGGWVIPLVTS